MRILVVDDSRTMRMLVIRTLRQAGYGEHEILEAGDGVEAMEVMAVKEVDIVLCDWNMPRMNGLELLRAMRGAGDLRLFGFITSESSPGLRGVAEHEGASFVISKPFSVDTFQSVFGGVDARQATIIHEGLPSPKDLSNSLAALIGREVEVTPTGQPVTPDRAAVTWAYEFPNGTIAAAGALDLRAACALGTGFGLMPLGRLTDALSSGYLPEDLMANLREVLNVLVGLYSSMSDLRIALGTVSQSADEVPAAAAVLAQPAGRLDVALTVPGYGGGFVSMVYARSS